MPRFQVPCQHEDYPCCGCGGVTVLTGPDALDADVGDHFGFNDDEPDYVTHFRESPDDHLEADFDDSCSEDGFYA